jgi:ribonuclease BN (tRNA processing enzyme)
MQLDRIFISHTHSDHCCELPLIIQLLHVKRSNRRLDVFVPDEYVRPFMSQLNAMYLFPQHIAVDLNITGYADGFVYHDDAFSLSAKANTHLEKSAPLIEEYDVPNKMQCHSFRVETESKSLLYSADLGSFDDIADQLDGLNYAIVESTHIELDALFEAARSAGAGRFILTHLGEGEERAHLRQRIAAAGLGNVSLATDGLRLEM